MNKLLSLLVIGYGCFLSAQEAATVSSTAAGAPQTPPAWMQMIPFVVIVLVFYFFMIRPQAKKQRQQQELLSSLKVGDQIITNSGIFGRITSIAEQFATIEIANQTQIKILRGSILGLQSSLLQAPK